ncbi:hypothetical protein JCGZ_21088 [Jatropha curcas]|uniref:HTH three-helical bundle domain-containing protein n=1 Tax=Jatropha curcas TaxID=180498 RepID=A0A067K1C2_JATCU|nr:hypothetical protein JCGZ_21088 [Jatropha curcas]
MMTLFPSSIERTVASALLLLSETKPLSPSSPQPGFDGGSVIVKERNENKSGSEESLSFVSNSSKSQCSTLTSGSSSSMKIQKAHKLRMVSIVARSHEMKFKVVRKRRSEVCWSFDQRKIVLALPAKVSSRSESPDDSCLSSTSSAASSARSRYVSNGTTRNQMEPKPERAKVNSVCGPGSAYMRRQAEAILKLLSRGSSSEVRIRQVLGDSPDTSKALRMLLKQEEIKRSGTGGRQDPYIYKDEDLSICELRLAVK